MKVGHHLIIKWHRKDQVYFLHAYYLPWTIKRKWAAYDIAIVHIELTVRSSTHMILVIITVNSKQQRPVQLFNNWFNKSNNYFSNDIKASVDLKTQIGDGTW